MKSPNMPLGGVGRRKKAYCQRIAADQAIECRFHTSRHHYISALAQTQTPNAAVYSISGHLSRKTLEHYSHVRLEVKRCAVHPKRYRKACLQRFEFLSSALDLAHSIDKSLLWEVRARGLLHAS